MRLLAPDDVGITKAARVLADGGLVAFPTETVYGLGADASNDVAVKRLFAAKGRPADHPVIVHLARLDQLEDFTLGATATVDALAAAFWPGPLTLILRRRPEAVVDAVTGGRDTVAIRVPDHPVALGLLERFGGGIAAPSANRFGRVSPTTALHVADDLGDDVDAVLDGGPTRLGLESTIVDCTESEPYVRRMGAVTQEQLAEALGGAVPVGGTTAAPGTLPKHYAPKARVEIVGRNDVAPRVNELRRAGRRVAVLGAEVADHGPEVIALGSPLTSADYARVLYDRLRMADERNVDTLLAVPPAPDGIGAAVIDRLRRAATTVDGDE